MGRFMLIIKNYPVLTRYWFHYISYSYCAAYINSVIIHLSHSWCWHLQAYVKSLVREAYINWNSLEEVDELLSETALLTQGI